MTLSAAALAGGLTFGLGVASPASAMPPSTDRVSVGHLCQQAPRTTVATSDGEAAPSLDGVHPGLRCGQLFGNAKAFGLTDDAAASQLARFAESDESEGADDLSDEEATSVPDAESDESEDADDADEADDGDVADESESDDEAAEDDSEPEDEDDVHASEGEGHAHGAEDGDDQGEDHGEGHDR